jgi:hypothetical protein
VQCIRDEAALGWLLCTQKAGQFPALDPFDNKSLEIDLPVKTGAASISVTIFSAAPSGV